VRLLAVALALALAGCASPPERPEAIVFATALVDVHAPWERAHALAALSTLGYDIAHSGPSGLLSEPRDGHTVFVGATNDAGEATSLSVGFRFDGADVCAARTYDEWVDALLARLTPLVRERIDGFAAASGWSVGEPAWQVSAIAPDGSLLAFPQHCGALHACVGSAPCESRSRWQDAHAAPSR